MNAFEEPNIETRRQNFNKAVVDSTIESLRRPFSESGLSEDLLDRLKASWEKKLAENLERNQKEAVRKYNARLRLRQYENEDQRNQMYHLSQAHLMARPTMSSDFGYQQNPYMRSYQPPGFSGERDGYPARPMYLMNRNNFAQQMSDGLIRNNSLQIGGGPMPMPQQPPGYLYHQMRGGFRPMPQYSQNVRSRNLPGGPSSSGTVLSRRTFNQMNEDNPGASSSLQLGFTSGPPQKRSKNNDGNESDSDSDAALFDEEVDETPQPEIKEEIQPELVVEKIEEQPKTESVPEIKPEEEKTKDELHVERLEKPVEETP